MRICHLNTPIEYYSPTCGGAVATVIMQQSRHLIARGHDVSVLTIVNDAPRYDVGRVIPIRAGTRDTLTLLQRGVSKVRRKLNRWEWPYFEHYLRSAARAIRSLPAPPDAVVIHNDLIAARHVKRAVPTARVFCYLHNEQRTDRAHIPGLLASADGVVTVSEYIRRQTVAAHGLPADRVRALLNGVDASAFTPRPGFLEAPARGLRVLCVGRLHPEKGADLAAGAVARLRDEGLDVRLTVAGAPWWYGKDPRDDPFFRSLKPKLDAIGADYLGHVTRPNIAALFRRHDVVCVLSRWNDPCPLVPLEAMASGCAVLASDRGGIPEVCGGAAVLVEPDDPEAIAAGLRALATGPHALRSWKLRALAHAASAGWDRNAAGLERILGGAPAEEGAGHVAA